MRSEQLNKLIKLNRDIEHIASNFVEKYFMEGIDEMFFVEEAGDMLNYNLIINGYRFSLSDMYTALWYNIPNDILWMWYDEAIETILKKESPISLKNFYLLRDNSTTGANG